MPNLRSQRIDDTGLSLVGSDGRSITLTRAEVLAHFQGLGGSAASRRTATIQWAKDQIEAALGAEQVPASVMDFTWQDVKGIDRFAFGS